MFSEMQQKSSPWREYQRIVLAELERINAQLDRERNEAEIIERANDQVDLRTFEDDYRYGHVSDDSDTIARCVDTLIAEPFSMREDRAVEVARAVLKAALDR